MSDQIRSRTRQILVSLTTLTILMTVIFAGGGVARAAENKTFVLCYHSFLGNNRFPSDISMEEFRSQMEFFKSKGFRFVSFSDLISGTVTGTQNILVVIDDGNKSVYQAYREILKPMGIKPTLAIYPNIIGKKPYAMNWDQLKELSKDGCNIAAHGYYHELMNQKFYDKSKTDFTFEIVGSKETLEKNLGVKISSFVYPNGVRADITKKTLKDAGYKYAFTINWGSLLFPMNLNKDLLELPRYMIMKDNWKMISSAIVKASSK